VVVVPVVVVLVGLVQAELVQQIRATREDQGATVAAEAAVLVQSVWLLLEIALALVVLVSVMLFRGVQ